MNFNFPAWRRPFDISAFVAFLYLKVPFFSAISWPIYFVVVALLLLGNLMSVRAQSQPDRFASAFGILFTYALLILGFCLHLNFVAQDVIKFAGAYTIIFRWIPLLIFAATGVATLIGLIRRNRREKRIDFSISKAT